MQPVSVRWGEAVRAFSGVTASCEVWRGGVMQQALTLAGGRVRADESSAVRRAFTCSLADLRIGGNELTPKDAGDLLAPTGAELRVSAGYAYDDGSLELVPVGAFPVARVERRAWLEGLEITAPDRSRRVSRARFLGPVTIAAGTLVTAAIRSLLLEVDPSFEVFDTTGSRATTTTVSFERGADRWEGCRTLAASIGAEVHVDAVGRFIVRPVPSGGTPVWTLDTTAAASMLDVGQVMDSEQVYNTVVAYSSEVGAEPVTGYAYISSGPLSVSEYGSVPYFFATPVGLKSGDQAVSAALAYLPRVSRAARSVVPRIAPHRALDIGDACTLVMPDEAARIVNLAGFSFSLGPDSEGMPAELRDPEFAVGAFGMTEVSAG